MPKSEKPFTKNIGVRGSRMKASGLDAAVGSHPLKSGKLPLSRPSDLGNKIAAGDGAQAWRVSGRVTDRGKRPIASYTVVVLDMDRHGSNELARATTDALGKYVAVFLDQDYRRTKDERGGPELYLRVFGEAGELLHETKPRRNPPRDCVIDVRLTDSVRVVRGLVRTARQSPVENQTVVAFHRSLNHEDDELGRGTTDGLGRYEIVCTTSVVEGRAIDLVVKAITPKGTPIIESPVRFNAAAGEQIDLTVPEATAPTEWDRISAVTNAEEGSLTWTVEKQRFAAHAAGVDVQSIQAWITAHSEAAAHPLSGKQLVRRRSLAAADPKARTRPTNASAPVDAMFYFAVLRETAASTVDEFLDRPSEQIIAMAQSAVSTRIVPESLLQRLEPLTAALDRLRLDKQRQKRTTAGASLDEVLDVVGPNRLREEQRRAVVQLLQRTGPQAADFIAEAQKAGLSKGDSIALTQTLRLARLTDNRPPLIEKLRPFLADVETASIAGLARLSKRDWLALTFEGDPGNADPAAHALKMKDEVETAAPEAALVATIDEGALSVGAKGFASLKPFLLKNAEFRFATTDVKLFIEAADLSDVEESPEDLALALQRLQTLKRVGAKWDEASDLIGAGLDSVEALAEHGPRALSQKLGRKLDEARIQQIALGAAAIKATGMGLLSALVPMVNGPSATVMQPRSLGTGATRNEPVEPSLRRLFGALDKCACDPCQSVLSPSAYLVDLLKFVGRSTASRSTLLSRRPDIYDLELSCDNAQIELPHVDLVIEILENAVALPYDAALAGVTDLVNALKQRPWPASFVATLQQTTWELLEEPKLWLVESKVSSAGVTTLIVADRYRRWTLDLSKGYFGDAAPSGGNPLPLAGITPQDLRASLNKGRLPKGLEKKMLPYLAERAGSRKNDVPLEATEVRLEALAVEDQWRVAFKVTGHVAIDDNRRTITLSAPSGKPSLPATYSKKALDATRAALDQGILGGVCSVILGATTFTVEAISTNRWKFWKTFEITLVLREPGVKIVGLTYQSTARDKDLGTRPQHRNPLAYQNVLSKSSTAFPWTLPFDVDLSEVRSLLSAASMSRAQLMAAALPQTDSARLNAEAMERLGASKAQVAIAMRPATGNEVWANWGLALNGSHATIFDTYVDELLTDTPLALLSRVSVILQQARISFSDFQQLLQCESINPSPKAYVDQADDADPGEECSPAKLILKNNSPALLDNLHRFVRIQRWLGWASIELDIVLRLSRSSTPADLLIKSLADLESLRVRLGLKVEQLATAFYGFDRITYQSKPGEASSARIDPLYERTFQNSNLAVANGPATSSVRSPDAELAFTAVNTTSTATIGRKSVLIAAALGIRATDVLALINAELELATVALVSESDRLTVNHLQSVSRLSALANALSVAPQDLIEAMQVIGSQPFTSPASLRKFLDDFDFVSGSDLRWDTLNYILNHRGPESGTWVLSPEKAVEVLQGSQRALRDGEDVPTPSSTEIMSTSEAVALCTSSGTASQKREALAAAIGLSTGHAETIAVARWSSLDAVLTSGGRVLEFAVLAIRWWRRAQIVVASLAKQLSIPEPLLASLLWDHIGSGAVPAIGLFADPAPQTGVPFDDTRNVFLPTSVELTPEHDVLLKLHKFALLNEAWRLSGAELSRFPGFPPRLEAMQGLQINTLPTAPASGLFRGWSQSVALLRLTRRSPGMAEVVDDYVDATASPNDPLLACAGVLSTGIDLATADVDALAGPDLLHVPSTGRRAALRDPLFLVRWVDLVLLCKRFGLTAARAKALIADEPSREGVDAARAALHMRLGEAGAATALVTAANRIRTEQRDRLVDYLLWRDRLHSSSALLSRYLIDVEMSTCMNTTRLLQSVAAVQLFVQRCLMNLERGIRPQEIDPDEEWEWRKNYRVWEANRKVFLFPENWLHPELRDDKSELFRGFESVLMQDEASDEKASRALLGYLEGLRDLAQISVSAMYQEELPAGRGYRLHVIGRSPDAPYTYYYRCNEGHATPGNRWTPWERVSLDLPPAHIVPFVVAGDIHLVWPIIEVQQDSRTDEDVYKVQLAWSRRTVLGWSQRKVASETATQIPKDLTRDERAAIALTLAPGLSHERRATIELYVARRTPLLIPEPSPSNRLSAVSEVVDPSTGTNTSTWTFTVNAFVKYTETGRVDTLQSAQYFIVGLATHQYLQGVYSAGVYGGATPDILPPSASGYSATAAAPESLEVWNSLTTIFIRGKVLIGGVERIVDSNTVELDLKQFSRNRVSVTINLLFEAQEDPDFDDPASDPMSRVLMDLRGRFVLEAGRETSWTPVTGGPLEMPYEVMSFESRFRERNRITTTLSAGLLSLAGPVMEKSQSQQNYIAVKAGRSLGRRVTNSNSPPPPPKSQPETWYWEEGKTDRSFSRFYRVIGLQPAAPGALLQPGGFEEAVDYLTQYATDRDALFEPTIQSAPRNQRFGVDALSEYYTNSLPAGTDPRQITNPMPIQFDLRFPYAAYNWEVFYHAPMAAARFLSSHQRYSEAQRWLSYVFNPTTNDASTSRERFWRCLPLRNANAPATIERLLTALARPATEPELASAVTSQIDAWLSDPFSPFAIARLRTSAYEWYAVVAYVRNLIEWGDSLFRRDTRESLNEAMLLYVTAAEILGRRPEIVARQAITQTPISYRARESTWDDFSNVWVSLAETPLGQWMLAYLLAMQKATGGGINPQAFTQQINRLMSVGSLYFCIPQNEKLLELWDLVSDRLWKMRHCQNIEGVKRPLALLEPPIDPELLIRARLAGVRLDDVLADTYSTPSPYRFSFLVSRAQQLCSELKSLGGAVLAAVEKKDSEKLSLLRSTQELALLRLVEEVKTDQISEAEAQIRVTEQSRIGVVRRYRYYQRLLGSNEVHFDADGVPVMEQHGTLQVREAAAPGDFRGLGLVQSEVDQVLRMQEAHVGTVVSGALKLAASVSRSLAAGLAAIPPAKDAADMTAQALSDVSDATSLLAANADQWSRRASQIASFQRRREDWIEQCSAAIEDIRQLNRQLVAAQLRKAMAEKELRNHRQSIEHLKDLDDYMRQRKFTTAELYGWMEQQLRGTYFSTYQLAYDVAKRAERAWRRDLGETQSSWIRYGYWDGAKRGLNAGEQLQLDLSRMEAAFLDKSTREFEITKHVSLVGLNPDALLRLREEGTCTFSVPEVLFDLDFPGHYFRRIKTVSLSIPCVTGPYVGVPCKLTLGKNSIRIKKTSTGLYRSALPAADDRFVESLGGSESVAVSSGQADAGLFETNLRDERYLPFEGAGVISQWILSLPTTFQAFDYATISDVVLHIRYTAREGGEDLASAASGDLAAALQRVWLSDSEAGLVRMFSLRADFPDEWYRLLHPADPTQGSEIEVKLTKGLFPFLFSAQNVNLTVRHGALYTVPRVGVTATSFPAELKLMQPGEQNAIAWTGALSIGSRINGKAFASNKTIPGPTSTTGASWKLKHRANGFDSFSTSVADILLCIHYSVAKTS